MDAAREFAALWRPLLEEQTSQGGVSLRYAAEATYEQALEEGLPKGGLSLGSQSASCRTLFRMAAIFGCGTAKSAACDGLWVGAWLRPTG